MRANTVRARKRNHIRTATAAATLATLVALATLPAGMAVAGSPREDPFDLVYSVEFEGGQITKSSIDDLDPEASYQAEIERKPDHGENGAGDHGKIQTAVRRLCAAAVDPDVLRIPEDPAVAEADHRGVAAFDACPTAPAMVAVGKVAHALLASRSSR